MAEATKQSGAARWIILLVVLAAVIGTVALRSRDKADDSQPATETTQALPRLLDLGADKCIPCKAMVPVLDELEKGLAGDLTVEFLDVWKNPEEAKAYHIKLIPTQIFFDAQGQELYRHEGFFARDDILAEWRKLGYDFKLPAATEG